MRILSRIGPIAVIGVCGFAGAASAEPVSVRLGSRDALALASWDRQVREMERGGLLRLRRSTPDTLLPGRLHERLAQQHRGVPVWGGEIVRQTRDGETLSIFGVVHEVIDLDVTPVVGADAAAALVADAHGVAPSPRFRPELGVLPLETGGYALAWRVRVFTGSDLIEAFVDAVSGGVLSEQSALRTTTAVGLGKGVYGDDKKLSGDSSGSGFVARDLLRPPAIETFDMKGDLNRTLFFLNRYFDLDDSDLARDADNTWDDGAAVDAHVYAGYVYDYLYERFGRRGLDDNDIKVRGLVHTVNREDLAYYPDEVVNLFYLNAFYFTEGIMVYGEGLPPGVRLYGQEWNYFSAGLDVVAHELGHGVTEYSSNLSYRGESGALNESYSDILACGVEFYIQAQGSGPLRADYLLGEDISTHGIRSMARPTQFGDPDHYSVRYTGTADNGGVHHNSGIPNHAFYLAIEGGVNRVSGQAVTGVGSANRARIEQAFYRAFAYMLPSGADFATARAATVLAATELFGDGGPEAVAIDRAWAAVGVGQ